MIFHPLIIALYVASLLICFMVVYASSFGVQILRKWDLRSGSELQLALERKTYLISTFLIYLFGSEQQKERWLPKMARGEAIGCFGLSEPDF